jgi:hypothetical protein
MAKTFSTMSEEPAPQRGSPAPNMLGVLFGGVAVGFVLGALLGSAVMRTAEQQGTRRGASDASGSTSFSGPIGAEGGGFDGEPLYETE